MDWTLRRSASRRTRRRSSRAATAAVASIVAAMLLLPAIPASAATKTIPSEKSGWFWSSNDKIITCTGELDENAPPACGSVSGSGGVQPGMTAGQTSPISYGHLGVSMVNGSSDMRSYVKFDASSIPVDAEVQRFVAVFTVSQVSATDQSHAARHQKTDSKAPATVKQESAKIQACAVAEPWAGAEGDPPYSTTVVRPKPETTTTGDDEVQITTVRAEPGVNSGLCSIGSRSKNGDTWRFDITAIAKKWASLEVFDEGIALIGVASGSTPSWTVEFHGVRYETDKDGETVVNVTKSESATASVEYFSAGPVDPGPGPGPAPVPFDPAPPFDPGVTPPADNTPPVVTPPITGPGFSPVPVGKAGSTPWVFLVIPIAILAWGLISGAIGGEGVALATLGGSNKVATVLQTRRLEG